MWKPAELIINTDSKVMQDPVTRFIRDKLPRVPVREVSSGRPDEIKAASKILKRKKRQKKDPLGVTIKKGKTVLYLGKAGKVVGAFSIDDKRMVCPEFERLTWASNGCFYRCDWCFLQGTYRAAMPYLCVHTDYHTMENTIQARLERATAPILFNSGELADSLSLDHLTKAAEHFIPWFARQPKGYLLLLTKSDNVGHILDLDHRRHTIVAWSMNAPQVSRKFEKGAPSFARRLEAARKVQEAGYRVRVRLDPIVPVKGWKKMYEDTIQAIFETIKPERITLGTLRFEKQFYNSRNAICSAALLQHMKGMKPMFPPAKLTGKNGKAKTVSGKYSFIEAERIAIFDVVIKEIRKHPPRIPIALCKESRDVWRKLHLNLSRCRCVCQLDGVDMRQRP